MSVVTTTEVIDLLGADYSAQTARIDALIPIIENWVCEYLSNWFGTPNWVKSSNISFAADDTISDSSSVFDDTGVEFKDGMSLRIKDSILNDGVYSVETVTAGTLTLDPKYAVVTEAFTGVTVKLIRMQWPVGIKYPIAKAIEFDLGKSRAVVESPARQNPSDADKAFRYPKRILEGFKPWHRSRVG